MNRHRSSFIVVLAALCVLPTALAARQAPAHGGSGSFTLEQVLSYPFPSDLVASPSGSAIAWVFDEKGVRNIWTATGPDFRAHQVTGYTEDDGQEITNLTFSDDGRTIVYVRGGDHDANWEADGHLMPDPDHNPEQPHMQVWAVAASGGKPVLLGEGDEPAIAPKTHQVAFTHGQEIWLAPMDGSRPARRLLFAQGESTSPAWSPDGKTLAFVSDRGDHAFITLYTSDQEPLRYLAPTTSRDSNPQWSTDGRQIAFVRQPGRGGAVVDPLTQHPQPWEIWVGDVSTLQAHAAWQSPDTLLGSYPRTAGGANLHWAAGGQLIFLADLDGWPHLYAVPVAGGKARLLTSGSFMVEYLAMSGDGTKVIYNANEGSDKDDIDRRHVWTVPVAGGAATPITSGTGLEWMPVVTGDGATVAYFSATAQRPPVPAVHAIAGGDSRLVAEDQIPSDFPTHDLVAPTSVIVKAPDGVSVHTQLFKREGADSGRQPAIIFVHGGPPRQMLLGWHYMDYYSNGYAVNQYLASRGYIVMSVNYRLGIGYGHAFHHPDNAGARGAAEYQDVLAAARYLQTRPDVDPARIGIWGGSYGGYLTALALARNSDVFKTGVDLHGVHNWFLQMDVDPNPLQVAVGDGLTESAWTHYLDVIWHSSPDSSIATWRSPVLLIQGDDDRNVRFHQTVDLAQRLRAAGVTFEELVLPDEIHGFLRHSSWLRADTATAAWFDRMFKRGSATQQ